MTLVSRVATLARSRPSLRAFIGYPGYLCSASRTCATTYERACAHRRRLAGRALSPPETGLTVVCEPPDASATVAFDHDLCRSQVVVVVVSATIAAAFAVAAAAPTSIVFFGLVKDSARGTTTTCLLKQFFFHFSFIVVFFSLSPSSVSTLFHGLLIVRLFFSKTFWKEIVSPPPPPQSRVSITVLPRLFDLIFVVVSAVCLFRYYVYCLPSSTKKPYARRYVMSAPVARFALALRFPKIPDLLKLTTSNVTGFVKIFRLAIIFFSLAIEHRELLIYIPVQNCSLSSVTCVGEISWPL